MTICFPTLFQLKVVAYDDNNPTKTTTGTVEITVERNKNEPRFSPDRYEKRILENQPLGVSIVQLKAEDKDNVSFLKKFF